MGEQTKVAVGLSDAACLELEVLQLQAETGEERVGGEFPGVKDRCAGVGACARICRSDDFLSSGYLDQYC